MAYIRDVNITSGNTTTQYLIEPTLYGAASTTDSGATYNVTIDNNFALVNGVAIQAKFSVTNKVNATLQANSTGAKNIYYNNAQIAAGTLKANHTYTFVYDGTQWQLVGDIDTNTTYTNGTGLNLNGTTFSVKYGTEAGTAAQGNDSRLSDARTPKSHTHGNIQNDGTLGTANVARAVVTNASNQITTDNFAQDSPTVPASGTTTSLEFIDTVSQGASGKITATKKKIPNVSKDTAGLAPKGAAVSTQSQSTKFLREDGSWAAPSYTTNTDQKVKQNANTENKEYSILLKTTDNATGETGEVKFGATTNKLVTINPSTGKITAPGGLAGDASSVNGHTVLTNVPANAVFTDTNKYHKTGSWNNLTYTATAVNSADELKFTIPTGTTGTTVALGNHTHTLNIATDTGTTALTFAANTKYKLTAGGNSYIFTTQSDAYRLNQSTLDNTAALSSLTHASALIYTAKGGGNTITDKPTGVDAFGVLSFKTADGWYGQLLMSSNTSSGIYWRTATTLSGGWKTLLDSSNTTAPASVPTLSWNSESTVFTLNGSAIKIKAMAKPTYTFTDLTAHPITISGYGITDAKIASGVITLGSNTITPVTSVNGHTGSSVSVTAADLGLSKAMRFIGVATVAITDGSTTDPVISGYTFGTNGASATAGDVIIDKDSAYEYVWSTTKKWERLGGDSSYKVVQTAVSSATAETTTATTFVHSVTQDSNGVITVKTRPLPTYNNYSHPTGDGNKHVPANGTSNNGKFLQATATAGTYQWASVTKSTVGLDNVTNDKQLPIAGGTLTGAVNTANNTWNKIGDDVQIGDINEAGTLGIQGLNGNTAIRFTTYNQTTKTTGGKITWNGTNFSLSHAPIIGNLTIGGTVDTTAGKTLSSSSTLYINRAAATSIIFQQGGTHKIWIDTSNYLRPDINNTLQVGTSDYKWNAMYATTFYGALSGNVTGNADTATAFSSGTTVKLTGDTTGESSSSTKGWSVATTTKKVTPTDAGSTNLNTLTDLTTAYYYAGGSNTATNGPVTAGTAFGLHMFRTAGGYVRQEFAANNGDKYYRTYGSSTWSDWVKYLSSANYTTYTVKKDGTGASGTWGISITGSSASCTGNAATATAIKTAGTTAQFYRGDNTWSNTLVGPLYINDTTDVGKNQNGALVIGTKTGENIGIDGNEIIARNNSAVSTLYLNNEGGLVQVGSGGLTSSGTIKSTYAGPAFLAQTTANTWAYLRLHNSANYFDIATKSNSNSGCLDFRPGGVDNLGPRILTSGRLDAATSSSSDSNYGGAAIQIRENAYGGSGADSWGRAPRLAFHWSGRVAAQIGLASNGYLYTAPLTATNFYKIVYEHGTWGISITGNAASATKVAAKLATTTKTFLLGTSTTITGTAANVDLIGDTGVYLTTTAGELSAVRHSYNVSGTEKAYTTYNSTDNSIDFIFL